MSDGSGIAWVPSSGLKPHERSVEESCNFDEAQAGEATAGCVTKANMTSALTKLSPHCPFCLVEAKIDNPPRLFERKDFVWDIPNAAEQRNVACWNCGKDYTARFYERQGEEL